MTATYDVIVVGLGAMGSAAACDLARRGMRVLALDQFGPGHARGSSHGESRIIRELYYEHPLYVPLLQRAYTLWAELEDAADVQLLTLCGGLTLGPSNGRIVPGARTAAILHGLPYEELSADEVAARCPALRPPGDCVGIWDARAGLVRADLAVRAFHTVAARHGAELRYDEPMMGWRADGAGVTVETPAGRYRAEHLVLCLGPWAAQSLPELNLPLVVERQVLAWFDPPSTPDVFRSDRCPIFIYEYRVGHTAYGFPRLEEGVKASIFHEGETVPDPNVEQPPVTLGEIRALRDVLAPAVPALAAAALRRSTTCLFTNAPDSRFVIGWHPGAHRVLLCSPCSGHGFKFAPAIGEIAGDLVATGTARFDLTPFALTRFMSGP